MNSSFKLAHRFRLGDLLGSSRTPIFCAKVPKYLPGRILDTKEPSFVSESSLPSLKKPFFNTSVKNESFRGFCTDVAHEESKNICRSTRVVAEVQRALLEYLHSTRGMDFLDAEHISNNSPFFTAKLLKNVENEENVGRTVTRFFHYHPINEFEPFFESIGIKPSETSLFLPRDLMFLSDDGDLIENYHALCNYGVARGKIGKIYKEATQVFRYQHGVLGAKLRAYEELGLSKSAVVKLTASSPTILVGGVNQDFVEVLEKLESMGFQRDWIVGILSEKDTYNWAHILTVFQFLTELGFTKEKMGDVIRRQPGILLDGSGKTIFLLAGLLLKVGGTKDKLFSLFSQFPNTQINIFLRNLWRSISFLCGIEMNDEDIQKFILDHTKVLGTTYLKKPTSVLTHLSTGMGRLSRIIKEDPDQLKKYALGVKLNPLPHLDNKEQSLKEKKKFLMRLGFTEDSKEMKKALTVFRGKGDELQDRYDFLVKLGLDPADVSEMIKMSPHILNQKIDVLESKISFLINALGHPLSSLVAFPSYMSYTLRRVNLRFSMYNWLKDKGKVQPSLAISSVLACSEKIFLKRYVNQDPDGPKVWENLKKSIYSS